MWSLRGRGSVQDIVLRKTGRNGGIGMGNNVRPFEETHPHLKEFKRFLDEMNKETDRGTALISAAMLDDLLGKCIASLLVEHPDVQQLLEGFNAPLGTLSARTLAAFALGLLSEQEYKECQILRKVRNAFAHDVHVSFRDQKVGD